MLYKEKVQSKLKNIINSITCDKSISPVLERPRLKQHGDISTNVALLLAKTDKKNPLEIAEKIAIELKAEDKLITHVEVARPGFINMIVCDYALAESLAEIHKLKSNFGLSPKKSKEKIIVEFVSANPTGDLHIGHGRQAVVGSCLVNLLEADGYDVKSEFYINDYGEQMQNLIDSAWAVYKKLNKETVEWKEEYYPEITILPFVKLALEKKIDALNENTMGEEVKDLILDSQNKLLSSCRINFDRWFSERTLHENNETREVFNKLKEKNYVYEKEGAYWFRAKDFNDTRDRVLIRRDQRPTYLLADIAYHINKLKRSDRLITIWGADHHGQEISLKGGLKALDIASEKIEIIFVQLVSLKKGGMEVKMSKREGNIVSVTELLNEVGVDAFRYFMIESHQDNRMVFDIDLAKKQDKDNPVYYIQYAHARCCSIFRQYSELTNNTDFSKLFSDFAANSSTFMYLFKTNNQEYTASKELILKILDFPEEVSASAISRSPNRIANYLKELATLFHGFYTTCRVISNNKELTEARLGLVEATRITIANGLKILGINAPEAM